MTHPQTSRTPLSAADRELIFRQATRSFERQYRECFAKGMADGELRHALEQSLGIFGGSSGPGMPSVTVMGSGLRIWGGWDHVNHVTDRPLFSGRSTMAMARTIYAIVDPHDDQLSLL